MGGVASFLIIMRPQPGALKPGHFASLNRGLESFQGIADFLNEAVRGCAIDRRRR
jgi:hypothetical protein